MGNGLTLNEHKDEIVDIWFMTNVCDRLNQNWLDLDQKTEKSFSTH